jgi:hypothetical protein
MGNALYPFRFRIGFDLSSDDRPERVVLPFQRSPVVILVFCIMAIIMTIPAIHVFDQATTDWGRLESLFDLVGALFSTGWLLGWSVGLLIIFGLLAIVIAGRETLILQPGSLEIRVGIPFLFAGVTLDPGKTGNLRHAVPKSTSGHSWRGPHLAFEYDGRALQVGSALGEAEAMQLAARIGELPAATGVLATGTDTVQDTLLAAAKASTDETEKVSTTSGPAPRITPSSLALIGANLVPVFGVLILGWDLGNIMVLFWAESGIIGFYHMLKLAVTWRWLTLLLGPIFIGHFGAFMAVHFLFIYGIFIQGLSGNDPGDSLPEVLQFLVNLWPALLALTVSHGVSFLTNFLGHIATRRQNIGDEMSAPYRRIAIMHLTIILGGGLSMVLGEPLPGLLLLILLKTGMDLRAHWLGIKGGR